MAEWYIAIDHANNGDGTTSAAAASPGAAGAFNALSEVANAGIAAGDTVHIKSGNGAGGDASMTATGATNFAIGSVGAPITFLFDDGTVWPGDAGTFKYNIAGVGSRHWLIRDGAIVDGNNRCELYSSSGDSFFGSNYLVSMTGGLMRRLEVRMSTADGAGADMDGFNVWCNATRNRPVIQQCHLNRQAGNERGVVGCNRYGPLTPILIDCKVTLPPANSVRLFQGEATTSTVLMRMEMRGGEIVCGGAVSSRVARQQDYTSVLLADVKCDYLDAIGWSGPSTSSAYSDLIIEAWGINGVDMVVDDGWCRIDSDANGNYPYLQGRNQLGDPWTLRVDPRQGSPDRPRQIAALVDYYTLATAARTITVHLLMEQTYANVDDAHLWMDVAYIDDATGELVYETTKCASPPAASAIASDTAGWSATIYGALTYDKLKLELTTANSIRQNTHVKVTVWSGLTRPDADHFFFIDPVAVIA